MSYIGLTKLLVQDYDEAIAWFIERLGFAVKKDILISNGNPLFTRRWVVVGPSEYDKHGCGILLAKAENFYQLESIGKQAGDGPAFFLYTDDFNRDYAKFKEAGVWFCFEPRIEVQGCVCDFKDLYDNIWQLVEVVPNFLNI